MNRAAGVVGIAWLLGAAFLLLRLAGGWAVAQRVRHRALPVEDRAIQEALHRVQLHFGVDCPVSLRRSTEIEAPVVLGARQPALLLPDDLATQMPPEVLPPLLAHECAHIARRDYAANIAQSVVDALLFFSPAAWWISRRLRDAREFCCDDAAVQFCAEDRGRYVRVLTTLASLGSRTGGRAVLGSAGPRLITRVRRLLSEDAMSRPPALRAAAVSLAIILVGAFGSPMLRVSAAHLAALPGDPLGSLVSAEWPLPHGYVLRQPGSSVTLHVDSGPDYLAETVTLRNMADIAVTSVTLVGVVEDDSLRLMEILTSRAIPVAVAPGAEKVIQPRFLSREDLAHLGGAGRLPRQVVFGVGRVAFANGAEWSMQPNPAARTHREALGLAPYAIPRRLIAGVPGSNPTQAACVDEAGAATSHGGVVEVQDEPGRFARCVHGTWIDDAVR